MEALREYKPEALLDTQMQYHQSTHRKPVENFEVIPHLGVHRFVDWRFHKSYDDVYATEMQSDESLDVYSCDGAEGMTHNS